MDASKLRFGRILLALCAIVLLGALNERRPTSPAEIVLAAGGALLIPVIWLGFKRRSSALLYAGPCLVFGTVSVSMWINHARFVSGRECVGVCPVCGDSLGCQKAEKSKAGRNAT